MLVVSITHFISSTSNIFSNVVSYHLHCFFFPPQFIIIFRSCTVFFGNLVWECQNEDLSSLLEGYNATEINVMFGRNGRSRGYALVTFATEEAASNSIVSFNEVDFQGRKLEVRMDRGPTTKTQAPREPDANFTGTSVFVANLSWATTSEELQTEFAAYSPTMAEVATRNDGKSRGWGTVQFATSEEADAAVAGMQGVDIGGRNVETRVDRKA